MVFRGDKVEKRSPDRFNEKEKRKMKKLMVLAAVAAMALGAKADWGLVNVAGVVDAYFAEGTSQATMEGYSECYFVSASDYNTWWEGGHEDINSLQNVVYKDYAYNRGGYMGVGSGLGTSDDQQVDNAVRLSGYTFDQIKESRGMYFDEGTCYAVIYNPTTRDAFGIANTADSQVSYNPVLAGGQFTAYYQFSNQNSPASVPEPTSGLLLLLGVAGLALKRRRV